MDDRWRGSVALALASSTGGIGQHVASLARGLQAAGCEVLQLVGAARGSAGGKVLLLDPLPATATLADLEQQLDTLRPKFVGHGVYAVTGKDYPKLGTTRAVLFVTDFADDTDRQNFCATNTITNCTGFAFEPT